MAYLWKVLAGILQEVCILLNRKSVILCIVYYIIGVVYYICITGFLEEPKPMELIAKMPIIHFKPVEGKRKVIKGMYSCPIYMFPVRTGTRERPSYVISADLRGGRYSSDFWCKRGVALLLSSA